MKVVYNACYGGFGLSYTAKMLARRWGIKEYDVDDMLGFKGRDDLDLVEVVEELGILANGGCAKLAIEEIPDGVEYEIDEYDGFESVVPPRQVW